VLIKNTDELVGKKLKFVAKVFRIGNPRHIRGKTLLTPYAGNIPVEIVKQ
jgi:hypothetical protein